MRTDPRLVSALALGFVLTGCGVSTQDVAERLPATVVPKPRPSATVGRSPQAQPRLILWFIKGQRLVPEFSQLSRAAQPSAILEALAAGPVSDTSVVVAQTLALDPVTGELLVRTDDTAAATRDRIRIFVGTRFSALGPGEQVLLLGQVVLSMSDAGFSAISFADENGAELAVPLPDGRLLSGPATLDDYRSLVVGAARSRLAE